MIAIYMAPLKCKRMVGNKSRVASFLPLGGFFNVKGILVSPRYRRCLNNNVCVDAE